MTWGKIRPQIALAIIAATVFSITALWVGLQTQATGIVTAGIGGVFGFPGWLRRHVSDDE